MSWASTGVHSRPGCPERRKTAQVSSVPAALDSLYPRLGVKSAKRPPPLENPQARELSIFAKLAVAYTYPDNEKCP